MTIFSVLLHMVLTCPAKSFWVRRLVHIKNSCHELVSLIKYVATVQCRLLKGSTSLVLYDPSPDMGCVTAKHCAHGSTISRVFHAFRLARSIVNSLHTGVLSNGKMNW
jgi:hypothetical protein